MNAVAAGDKVLGLQDEAACIGIAAACASIRIEAQDASPIRNHHDGAQERLDALFGSDTSDERASLELVAPEKAAALQRCPAL